MRLINADALVMHLADWQLSCGEEERDVIEEAIRAINEAPTIDAVPVVRCKDCKYSETDDMGFYYCVHDIIGGYGATLDVDTFCSYGERKDDECI